MASHVDSEVEADGAEPDKISAEVVGIELQQQQQQQQQEMKRVVADDGSELVVLTAVKYDEMIKRQQVVDWLYDQLHDEQRQRLEMSEKCRSYSEALARENSLVMRYRQLLISNRLQPKPVDDAEDAIHVGAELPETLFKADRAEDEEELELRSRCPAGSTGFSTESVQTTEELAPSEMEVTQTASDRGHRSVLEPDEAVFDDAGHHHWKNPTEAVKVAATAKESRSQQDTSRRHRQLLDEANDVMNTASTTSSSTTSPDLLQKVLQQNARLKQLLRKIVDTQGMTIREFLERSDYAELVEKLQKEIDQLRSQVKEQRQLLVADDTKLTATCAALTDKVQRLQQASAVKQALVDVYSAECVRLQSEVKRLSVADVASSTGDSQQQQQQQQQQSSLDSRDSAAAANIQKISQDFVVLRQKYLESKKLYSSRVSELESQLRQRTKQVEQLETDKQMLENKLGTVLQQICKAAATRETSASRPKTAAILSGCGQSRHLDRPWLTTSLPQTELVVDCGSAAEPASPPSSSSSENQQQQQQLGAEDNDGVGGCSEPVAEPGAALPASASAAAASDGDDGAKDDEDDVNRVYTCPRCDQEFRDETRYQKHCRKCCDD